ncbi:MAG: formimidoylglutamase [Marinirhabdus sp.]|nr:formimidoylglutamase [Marinirhabdus sp.]
MKYITPYTRAILMQYTVTRALETKLGEVLATLEDQALSEADPTYVLIGIPEDIGVRANHGIPGTSGAWNAFLKVFCNMQQNDFLMSKDHLVLGEVDCTSEMNEADALDKDQTDYYKALGDLVSRIDEKVSYVVQTIVKAGKTPILIGGGHNNSYGNLKGVSTAINQPLNCINFDAHSDFRPLEHRHSGNGFSYAMKEGYLDHYFIYGLHKAYVSEDMKQRMEAVSDRLKIAYFDDMLTLVSDEINNVQEGALGFIAEKSFGLEIDLDAIASMGSSAISPIGFSVREALQFVHKFSNHKNCRYIHLCEGAPNRELHPNQVGKTLAYLTAAILTS